VSQLKYVVLFLLLVAASRATPPDPVLDPLVQAAIESSPELASARAETEAARRRISPAGTLPDPTASLMYDGDRNMTTVSLSQVILWPGKRDVATRAAEHDALAMQNTLVGRASLIIEARVRTAWYELAAARETRALIEERARTAQQIEETARQRYATGLGMQQDVLRAQVEIARLDAERAEQDAVITARIAELQRLVAGANVDLATLPDTNVAVTIDDVVASSIARSPELLAAQHAVEAAEFRVEAAHKNLRPDFMVSGGPMIGTDRVSAEVGFGISLPIFSRRKQHEQEAEAEALLAARRADAAALSRDLEIRTHERFAALEATQKNAALYRNRIVPLDQLALESALASYESGKAPFTTVLEALNALFADRSALVARTAEAAKWRVTIDEASTGASRPAM
jgi:cobalt-zinc-cadmium efflux system outer membrane protein